MHAVFIFTNTRCVLNCFVHVCMFGVVDVYFSIPCFHQCLFSFTVDSMVQGNHIYKAIWDGHLGEELSCSYVDVKGTISTILLQFLC